MQLVLSKCGVVDGTILDAAARTSHGADDLTNVVHLSQADLPAGDVTDDASGRLQAAQVRRVTVSMG